MSRPTIANTRLFQYEVTTIIWCGTCAYVSQFDKFVSLRCLGICCRVQYLGWKGLRYIFYNLYKCPIHQMSTQHKEYVNVSKYNRFVCVTLAHLHIHYELARFVNFLIFMISGITHSI